MLSQLDSDVITPPKKLSPINIKPKQEEVPIEDKLEITKSVIAEESKPQIQLPAEPDDDDDDDDIEKIKSNIIKTLSKIEQAEVD